MVPNTRFLDPLIRAGKSATLYQFSENKIGIWIECYTKGKMYMVLFHLWMQPIIIEMNRNRYFKNWLHFSLKWIDNELAQTATLKSKTMREKRISNQNTDAFQNYLLHLFLFSFVSFNAKLFQLTLAYFYVSLVALALPRSLPHSIYFTFN